MVLLFGRIHTMLRDPCTKILLKAFLMKFTLWRSINVRRSGFTWAPLRFLLHLFYLAFVIVKVGCVS